MLWIGTTNGLNRLDPDSDKVVRYQHEPVNPHWSVWHGDWITSIYEDMSGMLWIGSYEGLRKLDPQTGKFTLYKSNPGILIA